LLSIFIYAINQKLYKNNLILQERLASLNSMAQESYSGIRIIKSFVLEQVLNKKFVDESLNYRQQALKIVRLDSLFMPVVTFLMSLSIIISIFAGGNFYIQKANAALTRISDIMMQKTEPYLDHNAIHYDLKGDIEFKNVSFTYPETGIKALDGASFKIPFGQKWLIVGKTGSGKSTIAELLMKYYKIDSGEILINGINIENIPLEHVRQAFSYVPQEVFLFSDTVSNNISFGKENIEFEDIEMAAKNAQISNEINTLQNGFQTKVGERGITLSGGQKQRISIARGILKHAPFYLFDDCLSAVDVDTEYRLIESFNHIEKASLILITHRIFNQLSFDSVICMDNGKIVEMGSHEELIKLKGKYYELYQKQEIKTDYI
jgi:ATP-binding cassette subfamily B protein